MFHSFKLLLHGLLLIAAAVLELTATFLQPVKFEAEIIALQTCLSKHPEASLLYVEHVWHR